MTTVSYSEVQLFRKCQKAHDYRHHQRLKRKQKSLGLFKGSILHDMANGHVNSKRLRDYTGDDAWEVLEAYRVKYEKLFLAEKDQYGDIIGDCEKIFEHYLRKYKKDPLKYEESEVFVARDLTQDIRFIGYIDKIAVDQNDRRWIMDHKFMKAIPSESDRFSEIQLLMYDWAWEGWDSRPTTGALYDYVKTTPPREPELLKKGGLSKAKNIATDSHTYLRAIAKHDLNPDDYADILEHLVIKDNSFFERAYMPRPPKAMIEKVVEDFKTSALMIQRLKGIAPRNMTAMNCKTCEFRDLCEAEVCGLDHEFVKKTHYEHREPYRGNTKDGNKKEESKKG